MEILQISEKKFLMRFLSSVTVPKNVKDPLGFLDIHCDAKYRNKRRGDPLEQSQKFQRKSQSAENIRVKNTTGGSLVCFRGSGRRCFCFGRGSGVSSMFWTSVVQVDIVEQMNKKVDRLNQDGNVPSRRHI